LHGHSLVCTGTTGKLAEKAINQKLQETNRDNHAKNDLHLLKSGPLGGDQQLGALITEGKIDLIIFLWDPMNPQPHDVDVKALLRIAVVYNIPMACNRATADFLISSPLLNEEYKPIMTDYTQYIQRHVQNV